MIKLEELVNQVKEAEVVIAGETVSISFYRHNSPAALAEALREGRITADEFKLLADPSVNFSESMPVALSMRLKSWTLEVVNGHGPETPKITSDLLARFREEHFQPLWKAVFGDASDVPTDADASQSG